MLYFSINHILLKWKHTLIQALEIAVIMFLGVIIITTFFHQSKKYEPFREVLQGEGDINRNYKVFDSDTNFWDKDTPLMFFALENMQKLKFGNMDSGVFIEYDDSITEEEKEYNEDVLAGFN